MLRSAAEHERGDESCLRIDATALAGPDPGRHLGARDLDLHFAVQDVVIRLLILLEIADVGPIVGRDVARDDLAFVEQPWKDIAREIVRFSAFHVVEYLGLQDVDARVDRVGEDLAPGRLFEKARDAPFVVRDHDAEFERVRDALQRDRRGGAAAAMVVRERGEVEVGECVAGDDEERFVTENVGGEFDRARGSERRVFDHVVHRDAERAPIAEIAFDLVGEIVQRGHDFREAVSAEQIDDVLHDRLVRDRSERLGTA
jgi:hypothetical protein